ncbi:MAG: DUF2175 family protein [Candidatus Thermoplasmatota archaeon]|jgi:hypothetical protein|nr:DUF2175 family protein [Candidatus Thermoplasmatota archaeon]
MAEFKCYVCEKKVKTGEKFTFTKKGSVHSDCFISQRRKEISEENQEKLRVLSIVLDIELQHLLGILDIRDQPENIKETVRLKYKDIEKACGETTRMISELN